MYKYKNRVLSSLQADFNFIFVLSGNPVLDDVAEMHEAAIPGRLLPHDSASFFTVHKNKMGFNFKGVVTDVLLHSNEQCVKWCQENGIELFLDCVDSAQNATAGGARMLETCSALGEFGLTPSVGLLQMEVCVDCVASARNAAAGGAGRLELCSALSEGGLTPSVGLLQVVKSLVNIPVFVMIRPRRGLDFIYSPEEVDVMELDLKSLKLSGADGFVFGALTSSKNVNESVCKRLLLAASPLPCTFHRAFDIIENPLVGLETIISLGFKRILTSGQEESAEKGVKLIKDLVKCSQDRICIMAGAGISEKNIEFILRETGVREFHASARTTINVFEKGSVSSVTMGSSDADFSLLITNLSLVEEIIKVSKKVCSPEER